MEYQYIFWDWNGTVVDDVGTALRAVNRMLRERGYDKITLEYYRELMDTPIIRFYEPIFDLSKDSFDEIAREFQQLYQAEAPTPYPDAGRLLEELSRQGRRQTVLSSSDRGAVLAAAEQFGYLSYFDAILGADNLYAESKAKRAVQYLADRRIPPEQCVLIGDTVHDYEVAQEMGTSCILLACGHQAEQALRRCGCPVCQDYGQLRTLLYAAV